MTHRVHYGIDARSPGRAACGRQVVPNWVTRDPDQVTCRDCKLMSDDYRDATRQPRLFPGP